MKKGITTHLTKYIHIRHIGPIHIGGHIRLQLNHMFGSQAAPATPSQRIIPPTRKRIITKKPPAPAKED